MTIGLKANVDGSGAVQTGGTDAIQISSAQAVTFPNAANLPNTFGFKNRIINGSMTIDQRNAGAAQTLANSVPAYCIDRWKASSYGANSTGQQISDGAGGNRYQITGAASVTAIGFQQRIESNNSYDLAGTTATLSVDLSNSLLTTVTWAAYYATAKDNFTSVTSIVTGTFTVTSSIARYSASISIPSAATTGLLIEFSVGAQTSGTFVIGKVQLEKGSTATSFDYRPYGTELSLCQRYLPAWNMTAVNQIFGQGQATAAGTAIIHLPFKVSARVAPTGITASAAANFYLTVSTYSVAGTYSSTTFSYGSTEGIGLTCATSTGLTAGNITTLASNSTSAQILATGCEL